MPLFSYTARNAAGTSVQGTITSISAAAARESLKEMHLQAEELYEIRPETATPPSRPAPAFEPLKPVASEAFTATTAPVASLWKTEETFPPPPPVSHESVPVSSEHASKYFPLMDTLRLYAGWLLSWYFLIFAFGSYDFSRDLPVEIPLVSGLFRSPVIISFAFGAFLFLMLSEIHKRMGKGLMKGITLTVVWFALFVLFRMNT